MMMPEEAEDSLEEIVDELMDVLNEITDLAKRALQAGTTEMMQRALEDIIDLADQS